MNEKDLTQLIEETILEMLKEGDEALIQLMMENEKNFGGEVTSEEAFVNETVERLTEKLGIIVEEEEVEDTPLLQEQRKMLGLVEWLEGEDD